MLYNCKFSNFEFEILLWYLFDNYIISKVKKFDIVQICKFTILMIHFIKVLFEKKNKIKKHDFNFEIIQF